MADSGRSWAAPTGVPEGTTGWYLADDGEWYRSDRSPAPGYVLADDGRWRPAGHERWRLSGWGLGDVWWGVLAYVVAGLAGGLALVGIEAITGDPIDGDGPVAIAAFVGLNAIATVGVVVLATRRRGQGSLRADFGLEMRRWDPLVGLGTGFAALMVAGLASYGIDTAFGAEEPTSNVPLDELASFGDFAVFFVAVAIVTPIVEELFFRGLLYRSILKRGRSPRRAIPITTLVFVLPHLPAVGSWPEVVSLFASIGVLGLGFNLACHWTGNRLAAPIVAHFVVNGLAVVALYVGQ
ncbi:MAG: CPBP family glutamic-type intramembrane protease [Ilumatobacteraceae bacterium]|nr:CPBP family glutamic-type intramembrane protease [Ilumatobacteraceae bacterium]